MEKSMDLKMLINYRRMRSIKRCNTIPTIIPIDVAQHSYYVSILAMAIADECNRNARELQNVDCLVDTEVVLRKALLHDTEESIVSDIPWNIKHASEDFHQALSEVINRKLDLAYDGTNTMKVYQKISEECKEGLEGSIVNIADTLELAIYSYEEVCMGNSVLQAMLNKCIRIINDTSVSVMLRQLSPLFNSIMEMISNVNSKNWSEMFEIE